MNRKERIVYLEKKKRNLSLIKKKSLKIKEIIHKIKDFDLLKKISNGKF